MTVETFFANFGHLADAPNGVQKLRELILQLAVQGKLVPQDPEDEPASVLLERIKTEKKQLVKEGKIKKQKPFSAISDEEKPFDLPKGWEFVRFGEITNRIGSGSTPRGGKNTYVNSGFPFLRSQNIWNYGLELRDVAYIAEETHKKMSNTVVFPGDILLNITGASLGRCTIFPDGIGEANVSQHVTIIRPTMDSTKAYLHLCVLSPYTQALVWGRQVGMAREGLSKKVLELFEIPLPPLKEQKRIVAKVDQLMALCDELEARRQKQQQVRVRLNNAALDGLLTARKPDKFADHWQRICTNFDLLYDHPETITKLRAAILQLAVQGKLVPQDPHDEPASVLLERIRGEKAELPQKKRGRRNLELAPVNPSKVPFQVPDRWEWARFGHVAFIASNLVKPDGYLDSLHVAPDNIEKGNGKLLPCRTVREDKVRSSNHLFFPGQIIYSKIRPNLSKATMVDFGGLCSADMYPINVHIFPGFLLKYMLSETFLSMAVKKDTRVAMPKINQEELNKILVPVPPMEEQKRIVAKVDQLMALCDELEAKLNQTRQQSEKLMTATVRHLLVA